MVLRMTHDDIIRRIGSDAEVGEMLGRHHTRVFRWRSEGIPPYLFAEIIRIAKLKRRRVTMTELIESSPNYGRIIARSGAPIRQAS
jgi:hypothetical protein